MDDAYRTVIGAKLNGRLCYFDLDICTSRSLNSSATVPQYPVEAGVVVSDHMYRNARTLTLNGAFSLAGRNAFENNDLYTLDNITGGTDGGDVTWEEWFAGAGADLKGIAGCGRLEAIQRVFEFIQSKGVLCTVMMCSGNPSNGSVRFKVRDNMVLSSISWTEEYNSMHYTLGFTEVITVSQVGEFETFDYSALYPTVYLPGTKSLGALINESGTLYETVLTALIDTGFIDLADAKALTLKGIKDTNAKLDEIFSNIVPNLVQQRALEYGIIGGVVGLSVGVAATAGASVAAASGVAAGATVALASNPIGWMILGVIAVAAVGALIGAGVGRIQEKTETYRRAKNARNGFNLIRDYAVYVDPETFEPTGANIDNAVVDTNSVTKLRELLEDIQYDVDNMSSNLEFYTFTNDITDNKSRDTTIQCGNDLLTIRIVRQADGSQSPFRMQIYRGVGDEATPVTPLHGDWSVASGLTEMKNDVNAVYKDTSRQYRLFLLNIYSSDDIARQAGYNSEEDARKNLCTYNLCVARENVEDEVNKLSDTIINALSNYGYGE